MGQKETQKEMILKYLQDFGSISSWDAYADLGITQLGARIFELKEKGYVFKKERVKRLNRYGREIAFDKYSLAEVGT
jgi:hypothetical protein